MGQENPSGHENLATDSSKTADSTVPVPGKVEPEGLITDTAKAEQQDANDERGLRHSREAHVGFKIGQYLQSPPFFFTRDKWPAPLVDMYRGHPAFLIASGPSFASVDHSKLQEPGILTMGLNNSVKTFRPKLWTSVDDPANFIMSTWLDPTIQKFVPISHIDKPLFDSNNWRMTDIKVGECPNVWYYKRNERFKADQFLWEDSINWGNHTNLGGGRSVLLAAVRILFLLGVRKIFLLGVDLDMSADKKYHFEQDRAPGSIRGNNSTYRMLQERFKLLKPQFDAVGLEVFNCNPSSKLTVFEHLPFEEAIKLARHKSFPTDTANERTEGLYDRKANEQKKVPASKPKLPTISPRPLPSVPAAANKAKGCQTCTRNQIEQVKQQVNDARTALHEAKDRTATYKKLNEDNDPSFNVDKLSELVKDEENKRKVFRRLCAVRNEMMGIK